MGDGFIDSGVAVAQECALLSKSELPFNPKCGNHTGEIIWRGMT